MGIHFEELLREASLHVFHEKCLDIKQWVRVTGIMVHAKKTKTYLALIEGQRVSCSYKLLQDGDAW